MHIADQSLRIPPDGIIRIEDERYTLDLGVICEGTDLVRVLYDSCLGLSFRPGPGQYCSLLRATDVLYLFSMADIHRDVLIRYECKPKVTPANVQTVSQLVNAGVLTVNQARELWGLDDLKFDPNEFLARENIAFGLGIPSGTVGTATATNLHLQEEMLIFGEASAKIIRKQAPKKPTEDDPIDLSKLPRRRIVLKS